MAFKMPLNMTHKSSNMHPRAPGSPKSGLRRTQRASKRPECATILHLGIDESDPSMDPSTHSVCNMLLLVCSHASLQSMAVSNRGSAAGALAFRSAAPCPWTGGNGVLNHLSDVKIFQDLRTCSLRPHPMPPTLPHSASPTPPSTSFWRP